MIIWHNHTADIEEIIQTIPETRGTAWQKFLEGKEILDAEDDNMIVEATVRSRLFQEGHLHAKIDQNILRRETEDTKVEIVKRCTCFFDNVTKAHEANKVVAQDLKELSTLIKDPEVFSEIAQAATSLLVAYYTQRIDKFIAQRQTEIKAKHNKLSQHKSMTELMEMSNLPQYTENWGDKKNKEKVQTRYMATIVWFFQKREMSGAAPNIGNIADVFKISHSQLFRLITAKKFQSGPSGYIQKRQRMVAEGEPSVSETRKVEGEEPEGDELEDYLLQ